jgi:hypothetical protein
MKTALKREATMKSIQMALLALCLAGCNSTDPNQVSIALDHFTVPSGAEAFECFYTDITPDREWAVTGSSGQQAAGGHHITVYYTNQRQPTGHHPCTEDEMLNWRLVAGAGGHDSTGAEGIVSLPPGLAMKVPAGTQIVVQAHYINATPSDVEADDHVTMQLAPSEAGITFANFMVADNDGFQIPALTMSYHNTMTCSVPQDLQVILMLPHMHEFGTHFALDEVDANGAVTSNLMDYDWDPVYTSHPPVTRFPMTDPFLLAKGTRLRVSCDWDNTTDQMMRFPREMCLSFMYYYPDNGELDCGQM